MKRNKTKKRNNTQEKTSDAQCNCSPPADRCQSRDLPLLASSPVYILGMTFHGMEYPFGQLGSAAPAVLPPRFLHTCLLAEHGKLKSPWPKISATQQQLKHRNVINIILTLNPKHSTVPATKKKVNSVPAETRTISTPYSIPFTLCPDPTLSNTLPVNHHHLSCLLIYTYRYHSHGLWAISIKCLLSSFSP